MLLSTKAIPLTGGKSTIVDESDYEWLSQWKWQLVTGYARREYRIGGGKRVVVRMHRELSPPPDGYEVDHINGDRLDNRRCNLRICTRRQNLANRPIGKTNTSGFKGVHFSKLCGKFIAQIVQGGKKKGLGYYNSAIAAHEAYRAAAIAEFGEFARF